MNIVTQWQRFRPLLAAAFCLVASIPTFACDVVVLGGQPVVVNVFLDVNSGTATLSGANIMAVVKGTTPGCNEYQFYETYDKSTYLGNSIAFNCSDASNTPYTFIVRMDDFDGNPDNGNESNGVLLSVIVHDNTNPTVTCPSNVTVNTDSDGNQDCKMNFPNGPLALTYNENCPAFVGFNLTGATTTGGYVAGQDAGVKDFNKGVTTVTYRVTDVAGHQATCAFTVLVKDVNPPILNGLPPVYDTIGCNGSFADLLAHYKPIDPNHVTAIDSCDGARPVIYTVKVDSFPSSHCPIPYRIVRKWKSTDSSNNMVMFTQYLSVIDTLPPTITGVPNDTVIYTPPNDIFYCDAYFSIKVLDYVTDCQPDDSLSVYYEVNGFPAATLNGFYAVQNAPHILKFWVSDKCGYISSHQINLHVVDATPPVASCVSSLNINLNPVGTAQVFGFQLNQGSFDNCTDQPDLVLYSQSGIYNCNDVGVTNYATLIVVDSAGNYSTCVSEIHVQDNVPPVIHCPANVTFNCAIDETIAGQATATDACGVANISFNELTYYSAGVNCFEVERQWIAHDVNGNPANCFQYITVQDTLAPILYGVPEDDTLPCGSPLPVNVVTAVDDCAGSWIVYPSIDTTTFLNCASTKIRYKVTRTWSVEDPCGNLNITYQDLWFIDTTAVNTLDVPEELTFYTDHTDCDAQVAINLNDYDIYDECGGQVFLSPAQLNINLMAGEYAFSFATADVCNNFGFDEILIHVVDETVPEIVCHTEINVVLDNTGFHTMNQNEVLISASDNCGIADISINPAFVSCADANLESLGFGPTDLQVIVTDFYGNESVCPVLAHVIAQPGNSVSIDILDYTDPTFYGANDGTADMTLVTGGSGDYDYAFFDANQMFIGSGTSINGLPAGDYFARVEDNQTSCLDVQFFTLNDGPLPLLRADTVAGASGDTLCVPITVAYFQNIVSAQMEISVPDNTVGKVIAVENYQPTHFSLAVPQMPTNNFTVSMLSPTLSQVDLNDGDTLFVLKIKLVGGLYDTTSVEIVDGSVELTTGTNPNFTTLPSQNEDGFVAINSGEPDVLVAGTIAAWYNPTVALVDVDLNNGQDSYQTISDGYYEFSVPNASPVVLTPSKDINYWNGVDVLDLITIQRHILGDPISLGGNPYRYIAADANGDGIITTFDLVELLNVILNQPNVNLATNTSWRFVPKSWTFAPIPIPTAYVPPFIESINLGLVLADTLKNDFVAIKIGDVTGDANPAQLKPIETDDRSPFLFKINDRSILENEMVEIPVRANGFNNRLGWQMTLAFETELLDFQGVTFGQLAGLSERNFGFANLADGFLTSAWMSPQPTTLSDDAPIFTLKFRAKKAISSLENLVRLGSWLTPAFGADAAGNRLTPQISWGKTAPTTTTAQFELFQNRPNPFNGETVIGFSLPTTSETTFSIFDAAGKLVQTQTAAYEKGFHEIHLSRADLPNAGVYFYEIRTPNEVARKRMTLIK